MYCGEMMSRYSQPAGKPSALMSRSNPRAVRRPRLIWKLPSMSGSLINPFQPTVVRGFSKYTRMMISSSPPSASRKGRRRRAYSMAALGSWMEHGPITTARRSSRPCRISCRACRAMVTTSDTESSQGNSAMTSAGVLRASILRMRRSSVWGAMGLLRFGQDVAGKKKTTNCAGGLRDLFCVGTLERTLPFLRHWRGIVVLPCIKAGVGCVHGRIETRLFAGCDCFICNHEKALRDESANRALAVRDRPTAWEASRPFPYPTARSDVIPGSHRAFPARCGRKE